jgi:signal transduction histidine kinase
MASIGFSRKHTLRKVKAVNDGVDTELSSQNAARGNNSINDAFRLLVVGLGTEHYPNFGLKFAAEKLLQRHGIEVKTGTLRRLILCATSLDFVRNDALPLHFEKVDLRLLIEGIINDHIDTGENAHVEQGSSLTVIGAPSLLRRIFSNLVTNAITYGGKAAIVMSNTANWVVVEVRDNGPSCRKPT